jgi:hypothetical protein
MKKLNVTKGILWGIATLGGVLVSQGLITGEELSALQNVVGLAVGGGSITAIGVITILQAIPKTLITKGYEKAVELYGEDKVNKLLDKFLEYGDKLETLEQALNAINEKLDTAEERRNNLLG